MRGVLAVVAVTVCGCAHLVDGAAKLGDVDNGVYLSFDNVGSSAVFGAAFPTPNPTNAVKATMPQTFLTHCR